ncbi:MAG TPA: glycosyltransferase [Vicinamibacterales bacterium]|nr:glycosyltransferase [Vicinamibacterales bacterium]
MDNSRSQLAECDVSVIVPAYGGAATIADCLESIQRATAGRRSEIIVVESSGDGAGAIIQQRFPGVRLIQSPHRLTAGAARNRGAAEARGALIFFTDQDCLVPPDWISRLERHMTDPAIGAAGGAVAIRDHSNRSGAAVYFLEFLRHFPHSGPAQTNMNFLVGCNSVYRAEALKIVRFPDQTLGEDVLFSYALRVNGFGVVYDPGVEVQHTNRQGWDEFFSYNRKMGQAAADYHDVLQLWWIGPFFRAPLLAFLAPLVILPSIVLNLRRSRWSYLRQFLALSPMCLAGNLVWAAAFRRQALVIRRRGRRQDSTPS